MTPDEIRIFIIFLLFGLGLIFGAIRKMKMARKVQDTPRSKISSAPQGYVEVEGFAWPVEKSTTLVSGDEVVYYSISVQRQETRGTGKNKRKEWVTIFSHVDGHPFYVVDETGLAAVDLTGCNFEIGKPNTRAWQKLNQKEKNKITGLAAGKVVGFPPSEFLWGLFAKPHRVLESQIYVGSPLYLHGDFKTSELGESAVTPHGLSEFASRVFDLERRTRKNLKHLFDKNGDGKIDQKEAARGYAMAGTMARRRKDAANNIQFQVHGRMGSSAEHKLYLADVHEEHLMKRLNKNVTLSFVGGCLLTTVALGQFFIHKTNLINEEQKEIATETRNVASVNPEKVIGMHNACVGGDATACINLLKNPKRFQLRSEHITYYSKRACGLGHSDYCQK